MIMLRNALPILFAAVLAGAGLCGCRENSAPGPDSRPADTEEIDPIDPRGNPPPEIIFPAALRADDPALNTFIDDVLNACVKGEYGRYRLAVGSQYEPLQREHFERAWRAVKEVRIRKIMLIHRPTTRQTDTARSDVRPELRAPIYCAHATITLRDDRRTQPVREVVVVLIQENGEWKLGPPAPPAVKQLIMGTQEQAGDLVTAAGRGKPQPSSQPASMPSAEQ